MATKIDLISAAYEELIISGITTIPTAEEVTIAIKQMDRMVLAWQNKNVCLSYLRSDAQINPNQESGLNENNELAVILNLALRLCPAFGKVPNNETKIGAKEAYENLFSTELTTRESDPYMPTGAGHAWPYGYAYGYGCRYMFQDAEQNAPDNCQTFDLNVGDTGPYSVDFQPFLDEIPGETITSFTVEDGEGVNVSESVQTGSIITMTCTGAIQGYAPVKVTVVTQSRTKVEYINFDVKDNRPEYTRYTCNGY